MTATDPVTRDLAAHEAEQDAEAAREEAIEARIPVLANHALEFHPGTVMDEVFRDYETECQWREIEDRLCMLEGRGLLAKGTRDSDTRLLDLADEMRRIMRDAAERLARERAEKEMAQ